MRHSEDMGDYFRVQIDKRDLNYEKYVSKGNHFEEHEDYTSHNTKRLNIEEIETLLMALPEIKKELTAAPLRA